MKKLLLKIVIVLVVLVVVGLIAAFLSINSIVKKSVETVGPQVTKVDVKLGAAEISPFSGSGRLMKFVVGNPHGCQSPSAFQFDEVKLAVSLSSFMSDTIIVNEVNIQGVEVTLEGSIMENNLLKILNNVKEANGTTSAEPKSKNTPASPEGSKSSKKFIVKDLTIAGTKANLEVDVPGMGHKSMSITIPVIHLQNLGTAENGITVEELTQDIIKPLVEQTLKTTGDALTGGALKNLKNGDVDAARKSVTDLFKR